MEGILISAPCSNGDEACTSLEEDGCCANLPLPTDHQESGYFSGCVPLVSPEPTILHREKSIQTPQSPGITQPLESLHISSSSPTCTSFELHTEEQSDISHRDQDGDTQLHNAIWRNESDLAVDVIQHLAKRSRDSLNFPNQQLQTPLHAATLKRMGNITALLIKEGADICQCDIRGETPLHIASRAGYEDIVETVLRTANKQSLLKCIEIPDYNGQNCLHLAAFNLHLGIVRLLLSNGADVNSRDGMYNKTILHYAVDKHSLDLLDCVLCLDNVNLTVTTYAGETALQLAEQNRYDEMIKVLKEYNFSFV